MPIFASEPATTVRQRSPWLLPKLAYGAIFLTVAMAAYAWQYFGSRPLKIDVPLRATAKVYVHRPNFAFQHAWQEVLGQAKTEIRKNLHIEAQRSGQQTVVAISLSNLPAESIVPMVNIVASAYSQACRAEWKLHLEQAYSAAREKVWQTQRLAFEAQTRFEQIRKRQLQAMPNVRPVAPPQPVAIENPRWTEICRRLADLETREKALLLKCTPLHPSVQDIEMRIADVHREMASIPPRFTQESPAGSPATVSPPGVVAPDGPVPTEIQAAQQAVEQSKQDLQQAQSLERAALAARARNCKSISFPRNRCPRPPRRCVPPERSSPRPCWRRRPRSSAWG